MAQPISPSRARVRRASPFVTSASRRRRSVMSWGAGGRGARGARAGGRRGAVEGAGLHAGDAERPQAGAQLLGRLAAEGGDEGAVGLDRALADPAGHPQGQDPGLAGAGTGDDAEQGFVRLDRLALGQGEAAGAGEGLPGVALEALERHHHTPHGTEGVLGVP